MTQASLSDLVRRVASADPGALARWMLRNDRYAGRLDEREVGRLVAAALADGEQAAKALRWTLVVSSGPRGSSRAHERGWSRAVRKSDCDPEALASELGISVDHTEAAIDMAGHLFSADYRLNPPRIRLFTRALAAIDRGLAEPGVAGIVGAKQARPVLLAHEIYHHLDLARPITLAGRHRVTTLRLGPLHLRTELPSLAEIAAGRFAATLLGLHCHPKLLDLLLLWDTNPQRAGAWAAAFCAFADRPAAGHRASSSAQRVRMRPGFRNPF